MVEHQDPRIAELRELAARKGIKLPLPISLIIWFEDKGCIVDLVTGKVTRPSHATPDGVASSSHEMTECDAIAVLRRACAGSTRE